MYQMSVHVSELVYMCIYVSAVYQMSVHEYLCIIAAAQMSQRHCHHDIFSGHFSYRYGKSTTNTFELFCQSCGCMKKS